MTSEYNSMTTNEPINKFDFFIYQLVHLFKHYHFPQYSDILDKVNQENLNKYWGGNTNAIKDPANIQGIVDGTNDRHKRSILYHYIKGAYWWLFVSTSVLFVTVYAIIDMVTMDKGEWQYMPKTINLIFGILSLVITCRMYKYDKLRDEVLWH